MSDSTYNIGLHPFLMALNKKIQFINKLIINKLLILNLKAIMSSECL